jgi:hypothetical protein
VTCLSYGLADGSRTEKGKKPDFGKLSLFSSATYIMRLNLSAVANQGLLCAFKN